MLLYYNICAEDQKSLLRGDLKKKTWFLIKVTDNQINTIVQSIHLIDGIIQSASANDLSGNVSSNQLSIDDYDSILENLCDQYIFCDFFMPDEDLAKG